MHDFLKPPKTKTLLWIFCSILVILITFGLGIVVGYRRAIFSSQFDEHYYRSMYGDPFGKPMVGVMGMGPMTMHGVVGQVIGVASATIAVKDTNGNEESVLILPGILIRKMNDTISAADIQPNDQIVVIGEPNGNGQVEARFVRIFETSSSFPML